MTNNRMRKPKKEKQTNRPEVPQLQVVPGNADVVAVQILAKINANLCVLIDEVRKSNGGCK